MFFLTYQERKVLLGVVVLILIGSLIRHLKTETAQGSALVIPAEKTAFVSKIINPVRNKSSVDGCLISNGVNINTASVQKLQEIKGVGEVTARRIIKCREEFGEFKTIKDLEKVKGIGEKKAKVIEEYICF